MHDPAVVRGLERSRDLNGDVGGLRDLERAASDPVGERLTLNELEDQGTRAVLRIGDVSSIP
jgi:hypothetical protein